MTKEEVLWLGVHFLLRTLWQAAFLLAWVWMAIHELPMVMLVP